MDYIIRSKQFAASAKTVAPKGERDYAPISQDELSRGSVTNHDDSFFSFESAIASADASFAELIAKKK